MYSVSNHNSAISFANLRPIAKSEIVQEIRNSNHAIYMIYQD